MTYSGASWSIDRQPPVGSSRGAVMPRDRIDEQRMLRDREGVDAGGLAVPARDAGEAAGDVVDLDIERRGIEEVEPASGQHALPGAGRGFGSVGHAQNPVRIATIVADWLAPLERLGGLSASSRLRPVETGPGWNSEPDRRARGHERHAGVDRVLGAVEPDEGDAEIAMGRAEGADR